SREFRAVLYRCRCVAEPGWLATGRRDAAIAAQRPSAIRHHLVFARRCRARDLCRLPLARPRLTRQRRGMTAYTDLETRFGRLGAVEEAIAVLHWDAAAMMPPGGAAARSEQLATLRGIAHQLLTAPEIADLLDAAEREAAALGPWQRANLREMRRSWRYAAAVPADLVEAMSRACSESETVWRTARPADDFAMALPGLERVLALTREVAAAKADALGVIPYDALLDQYEPGLATETIDGLFGEIERFLPGLLDQALAYQKSRSARPDPRRCRRGHLSGACHPALPAGALDAGPRPHAARSARRVDRGAAQRNRGHAALRPRRLPAGHPLV